MRRDMVLILGLNADDGGGGGHWRCFWAWAPRARDAELHQEAYATLQAVAFTSHSFL